MTHGTRIGALSAVGPLVAVTLLVAFQAAFSAYVAPELAWPIPAGRGESFLADPWNQAAYVGVHLTTFAAILSAVAIRLRFLGAANRFISALLRSLPWLVLLALPPIWILLGRSISSPWEFRLALALPMVGTAGWLATMLSAVSDARSTSAGIRGVAIFAAIWAIVFFTLSLLQYRALHVPHGDSAMYEEHLWNLWNGKGFRSQIDNGRLFLGEHFQVIHVLLMPIYLLWPSLPTLNACECVALASGALASYLLCVRMGVASAAGPMALAYLLYFPLQHLCLEASWKTFRPETLGSVAILWMLLAIESRRWGWAALLMVLAWAAKEDYAIATAMLGLWTALHFRHRSAIVFGLSTMAASIAFLVFVLLVFIPYFRGGVPHYTTYFGDLGTSPTEVASTLLRDPALGMKRLLTDRNGTFVYLLLLPLGFLPIASPMRLAVALPTLAYLCLASLDSLAQPWFHFHAPLIPILFWSAIGGIANLLRWLSPTFLGWWVFGLCLVTGITFGRAPLSWKFLDPAFGIPQSEVSGMMLFEPLGDYAPDVYRAEGRAREFAEAFKHVQPTDRVAATDYVRGRFTHFAAAHVYPEIKPHVNVDDIDAVVIDRLEGWWGRGPTNPDRGLIDAIAARRPAGTKITVRGLPFVIAHQGEHFLVAKRIRDE